MRNKTSYKQDIELLKTLIEIPSFSKAENETCDVIQKWLGSFRVKTNRHLNNVWAFNKHYDESKPTILLNSHHDTVRPNKNYTLNPFEAIEENGKLFGLGSNDAGGCLVSLLAVFVHFYKKKDMKYNLLIAATAEEEISGPYGIASILDQLPEIEFALVGEPTGMEMAIAEKGLLVIDGYAIGTAGHAAHENTENAIYSALKDIDWIRNYDFPLVSNSLGKVKASVTQIDAGEQHNVVPALCHFVIDVRVNDCYSNLEVFRILDRHVGSKLEARSFRLTSSSISVDHKFVKAGIKLGRTTYGSGTISDQALLKCPSLKMGPGDSTRSHISDEFIDVKEIKEGIKIYVQLLNEII
ncbi:MAG: M20 family metallo-hydrolase [Flavobacteriales bacterium]|nr:M20 family metallo-hydrolase [Flavobacteriales bacterium]